MNTALFELLATHKIEAARVRHVAIALSQTAYDMHGGFGTYKGKFEALLSAHYAAAAILHDRALGLAQFAPQRTTIRHSVLSPRKRSKSAPMPQ